MCRACIDVYKRQTYDYATSGIDYNKGTDHHVSGSHYVKCTDEEFAKWCK